MCGNKEQYMTCYYSVLGNILACIRTGELARSVERQTRWRISQIKIFKTYNRLDSDDDKFVMI